MRVWRAIEARPWRALAAAIAGATLVAMVAIVMAPWLSDLGTYGFHDWDVETSFRYLTKVSLLEHGELPWWNAYACGGYPSWGYVEGATTLVSPWLPAYLLLPLPLALRVEVAGMALLGASGAYLTGSRFTRSHAARLLVAALWAVNGRWGLQTASGHTWHLAYALLPWCFYFFERARGPEGKLRDLALLGGAFAWLVYAGGIYPLPHTVLALGCYAALSSVQQRSLQPLALLALAGGIGVGLAAPKLLPMLDTFAADPRLIESKERLELGSLVTLLTHPIQPFRARPAPVRPYGWHEWGMYISWAGVGILTIAVLVVDGRRERALKIVGLLLGLLGLGAFHAWAPWPLLHQHVPVFRSQHVPSRFLYPAVLLLGLVAASGLGRLIERRRRYPWLDAAVAALVCLLALDVARVAQQPMRDAMWMVPPEIPEGKSFHFAEEPPHHYLKRDWAGPMLLSMMANTGVLNCYGVPRKEGQKPAPSARGAVGYRGEVYLEGGGEAEILRWSPNGVEVQVRGAPRGSLLVYNMSFRRGWRSDLGEARAHRGLVAVPVTGDAVVRLSYRPPGLGWGLGLFGCTLGLLVAGWRWRRDHDGYLED